MFCAHRSFKGSASWWSFGSADAAQDETPTSSGSDSRHHQPYGVRTIRPETWPLRNSSSASLA